MVGGEAERNQEGATITVKGDKYTHTPMTHGTHELLREMSYNTDTF